MRRADSASSNGTRLKVCDIFTTKIGPFLAPRNLGAFLFLNRLVCGQSRQKSRGDQPHTIGVYIMRSDELLTTCKVSVRTLMAVAMLMIGVTTAARSETLETAVVRGGPGEYNVLVRADDALVAAALSKLARNIGFKVRGKLTRPGAKISGTYKGSLQEVLSRVLSGSNYVLVTKRGVPKWIMIQPQTSNMAEIRKSPPPTLIQPQKSNLAEVRRPPPPSTKILKLRREYRTIMARNKKIRQLVERMYLRMPKYADKLAQIANRLDAKAQAMRTQLPQQ